MNERHALIGMSAAILAYGAGMGHSYPPSSRSRGIPDDPKRQGQYSKLVNNRRRRKKIAKKSRKRNRNR